MSEGNFIEDSSELESSDMLATEFRDGQLQIVEVTPFEMGEAADEEDAEEEVDGQQYMQLVDPSGKDLVHLDLMNFTLVRCDDGEGEESFKLVANTELQEAGEAAARELTELENVPAVTCVLQSSDGEEQEVGEMPESYIMLERKPLEQEQDVGEMSESYVMLEGEHMNEEEQDQDSYVMVEGEEGPIVFLQSELKLTNNSKKPSPEKTQKKDAPPTTMELLEKAKAVHKARKLLKALEPQKRGKPRQYQIPEPSALLSSPDFKLFLYSCRLCEFKCNATKELTAHKEKEHNQWALQYRTAYHMRAKGGPRGRGGGAGRGGRAQALQCGRCPYRAGTRPQLENHLQNSHKDKTAQQKTENELILIKKESET